jgi:adenylate kinase
MPLYFLGGAHGAGKSMVAGALGPLLGAAVITASDLIREEGIEPSTADKRVTDVGGNQALLLNALRRRKTQHSRLLLDGHYCLRGASGIPTMIPTDVFAAIAPDVLLLLVEAPSTIADRLQQRDGQVHDVADVTALCKCEREAAHLVSVCLGVPLHVIHPPDAVDQAARFIISSVL